MHSLEPRWARSDSRSAADIAVRLWTCNWQPAQKRFLSSPTIALQSWGHGCEIRGTSRLFIAAKEWQVDAARQKERLVVEIGQHAPCGASCPARPDAARAKCDLGKRRSSSGKLMGKGPCLPKETDETRLPLGRGRRLSAY